MIETSYHQGERLAEGTFAVQSAGTVGPSETLSSRSGRAERLALCHCTACLLLLKQKRGCYVFGSLEALQKNKVLQERTSKTLLTIKENVFFGQTAEKGGNL